MNGKVTKIFRKQALSHLQITLLNGELIEVTEEHPFYTSTGWIAAKELKPDSKIKTINGFIRISSIKRLEGEIEVYNFEVEKFHTYLVGSVGAVVHNKCSENNPYLVAWRKHKANGGSGLGFNMDGEATDQEFLDFIGSPEGQQYLNEYGGAAQGVNGSLFSWSVGRGVGGIFNNGNRLANVIPKGKLANHLFKGAGKLVDNPANRTLIQNMSNGKALVVDQFGKSWYRGVDGTGRAIYSYTQNGIVKGAGYTNLSAAEMVIKYGVK